MPTESSRVIALFQEAVTRPSPAARSEYLARECGADTVLRAQVEALLAANANPSLTANPLFPATDVLAPDRTDGVARLAGRYTLVELIGEGGMGSVYRAEQTEPVKRQVAVKLIKNGADSRAVLSRFDAERQALALMDHPHIARVFDGGSTPNGQPFFVMELVRGVPITQFCDQHRLSPKARLELFVPVCQAVQHAHQKGIIHRDIKPGNILVVEVDGKPVPKVIDFGLAKATEQTLTDQSFGDTGAIVGTPVYMSPEQADPMLMDIDTRTDVYALGVTLYELLTGSTPIDSREFRRGALIEMLRMVREVEPPKPSTRANSAVDLPNVAANRDVEPKQLVSWLRGDIDWIVMKALEKDRDRRYDSANGLARDVQRLLADEVVEARPPSSAYRLRKFVRRNKGRVVAASLLLLALVGGTVGTTLGMVEARTQRQLAEGHLKQAVENFQLAEQNQKKSEENYQLARGSVDRYLTQVGDNRLLNEPHLDELRHELLGSAREFYRAFADRRRGDPAAARDLGVAHTRLAEIAWRLGKIDSAVAELEAGRRAALAAGPTARKEPEFIQSGIRLCSYQLDLGQFDTALATADETLADAEGGLRAKPGDGRAENLKANVLELRAAILRRKNRTADAIADLERVAEILERLQGQQPGVREHTRDLSKVYTHRAQIAYHSLENDAAEAWYRKALAIRRAIADADPKSEEGRTGLVVALDGVAHILRRRNRHAEAIPMLAEGIAIYRTLVSEHPGVTSYQTDLAAYLTNLSTIYKASGQLAPADALNKEALDLLVGIAKRFPTVAQYTHSLGVAEGNQGNNLLAAEKWDAAITWFDRSNATLAPLLQKANDPRLRLVVRNNHWGRADALMGQGKFAAAIAAFDDTLAVAEEGAFSELRLARALVLARSGDHKAARAVVDAETAAKSARSRDWFDASKVLVAAATAAKDDAATAGDLQARAVATLRRAAELKYFDTAKARSQLQSPDFAPLRDRDDFKTLLADVVKK